MSTTALGDSDSDSRKSSLLNWLTPTNYTVEQADISHRRHPSTGTWLLESSQFQQWLRSPGQTLFCHGMSGAGKTTLTSLVVDHLVTIFTDTAASSQVGVAFVYCTSRRRPEQRPVHLLASLLRQLLAGLPRVPGELESMYDEYSARWERPALEVIVDALRMVTTSVLERAFVVVDAVDEGLDEEDRRKFFAELGALQSMSRIGVFVTAQDGMVGSGSGLFDQALRLEIRADVGDLRRYLEENVPRVVSIAGGDAALMEQVVNRLLDSADGSFLLANLTLASLTGYTTKPDVEHALETSPKGPTTLDHACAALLERISAQDEPMRACAYRILLWIVYTTRPLTTAELQRGLSVTDTPPQPDTHAILRICAGLVVIDKTHATIRLTHHTIRTRLERHLSSQRPQAETDLAIACIRYLSLDNFTQPTRFYDKFTQQQPTPPFYSYAAHNWAHHVRLASLQNHPLLLRFLRNEQKVASAARHATSRFIDRCTGLHLAAYFGLEDTVKHLLTEKRWCNRPSETDKGTALSAAAHNGHIPVVRVLLATGPPRIVNRRDSFGRIPLHYAAAGAHEEVFALLLVGKHTSVDEVDVTRQSPLVIAAREGLHRSVDLLLSCGMYVDVNRRDQYGWTPLLYTVESGNEEVVRRLLAHPGIDVSGRGKSCPPHMVRNRVDPSRHGDLRWVISNGVVAPSSGGESTRHSTKHFESATTHLTAINEEDPITTTTTTTPLSSKVSTNRRPGLTLLGVALHKGFPSIAAQLLRSGSERDISTLLLAAEKGYDEVVRVLVLEGVDMSLSPNAMHPRDGRMPLRCAAEGGHAAVVETLLLAGADPHACHPRSGRTTLMAAAENGFVDAVRVLVERGVSVTVEDCRGWTALSLARKFGHDDDVVSFLGGE